ncbi:hypothetical protein BVX98_03905 [bacterium F11]|nr:hypothetical protein BVX98_03905 [bacterium F11]
MKDIKKILLLSIGIIVTAGAVTGLTLFGLQHFMSGHQKNLSGFDAAHHTLHRLNLTEDQKYQLNPHETALKKGLDDLQLQLAEKRISVCTLLNVSSSDKEKIMASVDEIGALQTQQQKLVVQHLLAMRDTLTPEQSEEFFGAMMTDICLKCRKHLCLTDEKCMCGKCSINLSAPVDAKSAG